MPDFYARSKEVYNEGRVVGLNSYELYVREHIAQNPEIPPATEIEWLASSIAFGSSMLLYVTPDNIEKAHYREFRLPEKCKLGAANTLIASWFCGSGVKGESAEDVSGISNISEGGYWAKQVDDYGPLISNTSSSSPNGGFGNGKIGRLEIGSKIPLSGFDPGRRPTGMYEFTKDQREELGSYILLADGIVLQPGYWTEADQKPPEKDFKPYMKEAPVLRLYFCDKVEHGFWILFSGFTLRSVLSGCTGIESALGGMSPQDGDFLGPPIFPWSSKIVFTMPSAAAYFLIRNTYERSIPQGTLNKEVETTSIVDMTTTDPNTYYQTQGKTSSQVPFNVKTLNTMMKGAAVVTIYNKQAIYPPAIWGTVVEEDTDGNKSYMLSPLDVVAPGTVKMFDDNATAADLLKYQQTYPGTTGMKKDKNGQLWVLNQNNQMVPAAKVEVSTLSYKYSKAVWNDEYTGTGKLLKITTGNDSGITLSLSTNINGSPYQIDSHPLKTYSTHVNADGLTNADNLEITQYGNIEIGTLIQCLVDNASYDILQGILKRLRASLQYNFVQFPDKNSSSTPYDILGSDDGLRLYISSSEPTPPSGETIPIGSIGIGW